MTGAPLRGRTALVTGGSKGIGFATAERLAEAGAAVHVLARDPAPADALCAASEGTVWAVDLTDDTEVWHAVDALQDRLGGAPDIVVNSAGSFELSPLADTSVEVFDRQIAVNLRGTFLLLRALLPAFLERGCGDLVQVGSVAGRRAFASNGAYSAAKFGVRGLHEVLLEELRGTGVRATLLEPAATDTPLWDPLAPDTDPGLPDRAEMLRAGDVAEAVLFVVTRPPHVRIPLLQIERG
ncbi:MAG: SDR family oxidoreductase [Longimicrobiales bacterium]|nr:SDR family oxidoreductase [Longimicrobiales bacterium]